MRVFLSDAAKADLISIYSYMAERNLAAADAIAEEINIKFDSLKHFPFNSLKHFPFIGRDRSDFGPNFRSVVAGYYVIFYIVEADQLTIVRVLDGRRDIDAEFLR
jgi:toxin ParE1/3/4